MGDAIEILQTPAIVVEIAGPAGLQGPPGTTDYTQLINKPSTDAVTEGSTNLYHTSARASAAAPVQSVAGRTGAVTLAKADVGLANVANTAQVTSVTGTAPIASSGGTTPAISISAATTSAAGSMSAADKTKLDGVATSANNYVHPNHTGDVTSAGDGATTIAADAVTNAKLANVTSQTIKGRAGESTGDPEDLTAAQVRSILNVADGAEVNVNADWTATTGDAAILNKPVLNGVITNAFPSGYGSGVANINWAAASYWSGSLGMTGGTTIAFQNVIVGKTITLNIGNSAGYLLQWPVGITWVGGSPATSALGAVVTSIRVQVLALSATQFIAFSLVPFTDRPSTATSPGIQGQLAWGYDDGAERLYICVANNIWRRATIATWS